MVWPIKNTAKSSVAASLFSLRDPAPLTENFGGFEIFVRKLIYQLLKSFPVFSHILTPVAFCQFVEDFPNIYNIPNESINRPCV